MALTGFGRKCAITIDHTKVGATLTDFPILLTKDTLPSEMFDADGSNPALNGGGDIRFSSDADGNTQLACEVVAFVTNNDPANGSAEIWVKIPSLSSSADTVIYVWYNKSGESQPAVDGTYGRNAVWNSNYKAVWHMQETSGTRYDSTANGNNLTDNNTVGYAAGKFGGNAASFVASNFETLSLGYGSQTGMDLANNYTISAWVFRPAGGVAGTLFIRDATGTGDLQNYRGLFGQSNNATWDNRVDGTIRSNNLGTTWADDTYYLMHYVKRNTGNGQEAYKDATSIKTSSYTNDNATGNYNFLIGGRQYTGSSYNFGGRVDEFRICASVLPTTWISTEYNNQNSPATFATEGTPESAGGGTPASTWTPKIIIF